MPLFVPRQIQRETTRSPCSFANTSRCSFVAFPIVVCISATHCLNASRAATILPARCDAIILGHEFVDRAQVVRRRPKRVERNRTLIAGRVRESMRSFYLSDAALTAEDA